MTPKITKKVPILVPKMGPKMVPKFAQNGPTWPLGFSWALLGLSWGLLGSPWALLASLWGCLGTLLGLSWASLGLSWGSLGVSQAKKRPKSKLKASIWDVQLPFLFVSSPPFDVSRFFGNSFGERPPVRRTAFSIKKGIFRKCENGRMSNTKLHFLTFESKKTKNAFFQISKMAECPTRNCNF